MGSITRSPTDNPLQTAHGWASTSEVLSEEREREREKLDKDRGTTTDQGHPVCYIPRNVSS